MLLFADHFIRMLGAQMGKGGLKLSHTCRSAAAVFLATIKPRRAAAVDLTYFFGDPPVAGGVDRARPSPVPDLSAPVPAPRRHNHPRRPHNLSGLEH